MKKCILLLMLVASITAYSQNEYLNYNYSVSGNIQYTQRFFHAGIVPYSSSVVGLTASFFIMDKVKNQHEISFERFHFNRVPTSSYTSTNFDIMLGYKYHLNFVKKKNARWIPSIGFGSHLFVANSKTRVHVANLFPRNVNTIGLEHYITPALTFHASKRLFLNLSFPVNFITTQITSWRQPNFKGSQFELETGLDRLQVKLGIGIKF